jgi:hypothetical protein
MEDYFHATKVGQHSVVKLAQSYLKGYASTWWRTMRQEERKTNGYTWEFFKKHIELKFIPKNSNYISRCKLCDLMNATNDNLHQYVKVYSKLMLTPTFFSSDFFTFGFAFESFKDFKGASCRSKFKS